MVVVLGWAGGSSRFDAANGEGEAMAPGYARVDGDTRYTLRGRDATESAPETPVGLTKRAQGLVERARTVRMLAVEVLFLVCPPTQEAPKNGVEPGAADHLAFCLEELDQILGSTSEMLRDVRAKL
jgi:hypothetical protein